MRGDGGRRRFGARRNVCADAARSSALARIRSSSAAWLALAVVVHVDNLKAIRAAFGENVALEVTEAVWRAVQLRLVTASDVVAERVIWSPEELCFVVRAATDIGSVSNDALRAQVCSWLLDVGCRPLFVSGAVLQVALSWNATVAERWSGDRDVLHLLLIEARETLARSSGSPTTQSLDPEDARRDMAAAVAHYAELVSGELQFAWAPVRAVDDDVLLYLRAEVAIPGVVGQIINREAGYRALERLRLVAIFDHLQVQRAIDHLVRGGGWAVCVSVSATSFRRSSWWDQLLAQLEGQRFIAERLLVAVDCEQFAVFLGPAAELADRLRRLGCKIVLLGFGSGQIALAGPLALRPDVITLDPFLIELAARGGRDLELCRRGVALAAVLAPLVVAEGVDTFRHAAVALDVGVSWGCGAFFGGPRWRGPGGHAGRPGRIPPFQWQAGGAEWGA